MADGDPFFACWDMALEDVQVGSADGRVFDLDDGIGRVSNLGLWFVFEFDLVQTTVHEGLHPC